MILLETFKELLIQNVCLLVGDKGTIINKQTNKTIKQHVIKCGYCAINIPTKPKHTKKYVHRLVAMAFLNNGEDFEDTVNHIDYNKLNNSVDNLEIITREANASDSYKQEKHGNRKLSVEDVKKIKELLNENLTHKEIAKIFNISSYTVSDIKRGRSWKNV